MRYLLDTFFFGYLPLRWRRLLRFLILTPVIFFFIYMLIITQMRFGDILDIISYPWYDDYLGSFIPLLVSPVFSWLLKPFVVKK